MNVSQPPRFLFLLLPLWLTGCALLPATPPSLPDAPPEALVQAVAGGDCSGAAALLAAESAAGVVAESRLAVARVCLQTGDFSRTRELAADFLAATPEHPGADYADYLHGLAGFGLWSRRPDRDPEQRIREGRALFLELAAHLRERPASPYGEELAPRLVRLREGIAAAEFRLLEAAMRVGDHAEVRARADYLIEHYPRTQAAADAARLLILLAETPAAPR